MIIDNDIFWNNFNFHAGQPAVRGAQGRHRGARPGRHRRPAARRPRQPDREQPHLRQLPGRRRARSRASCCQKNPDAQEPRAQHRRATTSSASAAPTLNGNDIMYDGNGSDNCFSMDGVNSTFPADGSTFAGCGGAERVQPVRPGPDARLHRRGRAERLEQAPAPRQAGLHAARGLQVRRSPDRASSPAPRSSARRRRTARRKKTVNVGDNYYTPKTLTVKRGTTVTWRGPASSRRATSTTSSSSPAPRA